MERRAKLEVGVQERTRIVDHASEHSNFSGLRDTEREADESDWSSSKIRTVASFYAFL
jgi:hypothetical protein